MEHRSLKNCNLNLLSATSSIDFSNFSLLSETESDRAGSEAIFSQINELKSRLEVVNEDRQRLKAENEKLRSEHKSEFFKTMTLQKSGESEKVLNMKEEVARLRRECEEKDKLLNIMRSLLGNNEITSKENIETKIKKNQVTGQQSRLPGTRVLMKTNRSISPYTKF